MKSYEGTRVCEISGGPVVCDVPGFALQSEGFTESKLILLTADRSINRETRYCVRKQQFYSESQQTKKTVESCPKGPFSLS